MTTYGNLFQRNQLAFTVYTPDAVQGHLIGNLDHHIQQETGLMPGFRKWIRHDVVSLTEFYGGEITEEKKTQTIHDYENVPLENVQYGHLFARFIITGYCLLTIWQGDAAIEKLLDVKGKTNPAESPTNTIRGSFWCDNAICNLTHCSDDSTDAHRELSVLKLTNIFEQEAITAPLFPPEKDPRPFISHSAIYITAQLVNRLLLNQSFESIPVSRLESHDSKENMWHLTNALEAVRQNYPDTEVSHFIQNYLEGDFVAVAETLQKLPVSRWEELIIQCGTITRERWNAMRSS